MDALTLHTDEGRASCDKLGGAAPRRYTPRYPNGATRQVEDLSPESEVERSYRIYGGNPAN